MNTALPVDPEDSAVIFEQYSSAVCEFKLNRPKALNALTLEMCHTMVQKIKQWSDKKERMPRALIVSGVGGRAFSAGGDIAPLYRAGLASKGPEKEVLAEFPAIGYILDYSVS